MLIECEPYGDAGLGDPEGTLEVTVAGRAVGRPNVVFLLSDALESLKWAERDRGRRREPKLNGRSPQEIARVISDNLAGRYERAEQDFIEEPARLSITPRVDPFGASALFLVADAGSSGRVVALDLTKNEVWEAKVDMDQVESDLVSLYRFILELTERS